MKIALHSFLTFTFFLLIDLIWITFFAAPTLENQAPHLINSSPLTEDPLKLFFGFLVYILIVGGLLFFIIWDPKRSQSSFKNGFTFGLILYGVYELTNLAALEKWPYSMVLGDTIWGGVICGTTAWVGVWFKSKIIKRVSP